MNILFNSIIGKWLFGWQEFIMYRLLPDRCDSNSSPNQPALPDVHICELIEGAMGVPPRPRPECVMEPRSIAFWVSDLGWGSVR